MDKTDFRAIVEQLPLVVYVDALDERSTPIYISPQIHNLLGYTAEEWEADPELYPGSIHPDDRARVLETIELRNASGTSDGVSDYRLLARDGSIVWVRDEEIVVRGEDGNPIHAQGYLQDVTERQHEHTRLQLLLGVLAGATAGASADELIRTAVVHLGACFTDVRASFVTIQDRTTRLVHSSDANVRESDVFDSELSDWYLDSLERGTPVVVGNVTADPRLEDAGWFVKRDILAYVDVPIRTGRDLVGVLCFDSPHARPWREHEILTFADVGEQLAVVLSEAYAREQRARADADLQRRDAILEAVTRSAERLLSEPSWETAAPELLHRLGEAVEASRAYVFQNDLDADGRVVTSQRFEWVASGLERQIGNAVMQRMRFDEVGLARFEEVVGRDEIFGGNVRNLSAAEREFFEAQQIRSIMTVPIFVDDSWWGFIGFDECRNEREWSAAETDTLRLASSLLAAAIRRERNETILREQEQKLRAVFETALDAIFISNDERRYVDLNPAACELLGMAKRDVVGTRMEEFLPAERLATIEADWAAYTASDAVSEEWQILRSDGSVRQVEASARPNFLPGLHIAFLRDVTERKQLEAELLGAQKLESLGRLAGGVAHDFNNLLTAITGYSTLLLERTGGDVALAHDLGEIQRAAERAAGLTRQLLAFGRRQMLQPRALDLNDVLGDVGSLLRRLLGEHVELALRPAPSLGTVRADPGQIEQVIVNLAVNARDAMPAGGKLTISTRDALLPDESPVVELEVSDTGIGMDDATRAQIFEPFFTTRDEGVGLGLASVYGIVRQSGGEVTVRSVPGAGSVFTVRLPRVEGDARTPEPPTVQPAAPGSETILLVEDEDVVRALARRVLERQGYTVLACANGAEAIEVAESHAEPIHLMLTDVVMPGLRGHEVAERVSVSRPAIKVLYMSGYAEEALLGQVSLSEGSLIEKPFAVDVLAGRIREALDHPSAASVVGVTPR